MRVVSPVLVLGAALSLAACTVGPDYQPPTLPLPDSWQTQLPPTSSNQRLADWWRQLADPHLDGLIQRALSGNLDVKLAQARLTQARASRDMASADYFPTVTTSLGGTRSKAAASTSGKSQRARTVYDAGFDASWEIDIFGGTRRAVEAAEADMAASQADVDAARVSLVAELAQTYVELRSYQRRLGIARDNLAAQTETLQITEWRNRAGLANSSDVEQARTNREQTRAGIPDLEIGLAESEHRLAVLVGAAPGSLHQDLADPRPLPDISPAIASGIPADVLRQRPDLIAAERSLAAETARVGQKMAQRFPSLSLGGSLGWQAYTIGALGNGGTLTHALTGTLAATLFDGGRLRSAVDVQSAVQEQALISYQNSVLTALEEVENALSGYAQSRERIDARQGAADAARNAAQLTRRTYESGLADFQTVLTIERTLLTAQDNLALAEATRLTSLIKVYKALGGGWQQPADTAQLGTAE